MKSRRCGVYWQTCIDILIVYWSSGCLGLTDPTDVFAIKSLMEALNSPALDGWNVSGEDPCGEHWKGVFCMSSQITALVINTANLTGELDNSLYYFTSIRSLDFRNNSIGGSLPSKWPFTLHYILLSGNQFNGSIPASLLSLVNLTMLILSDNHFTGDVPDMFQQSTSLLYLDLSSNNLSGQLPSSLGTISTLTTLNLSNNELSGPLDALVNLKLKELDVENNQFSGPIPPSLLNIPTFRKDGNPFNTTVIPSSPPSLPPETSPVPPPTSLSPTPSSSPSPSPSPQSSSPWSSPAAHVTPQSKKNSKAKRVYWTIVIVFLLLLATLLLILNLRGHRNNPKVEKFLTNVKKFLKSKGNMSNCDNYLPQLKSVFGKVPREGVIKPQDSFGMDYIKTAFRSKEKVAARKTMDGGSDAYREMGSEMPPLSPPPVLRPPLLSHDMAVSPTALSTGTSIGGEKDVCKDLSLLSSLRNFSISSLQQYTGRFSEDNFIGRGMLGSVYRAESTDGLPLAVKKLDDEASRQTREEFLQLVCCISEMKHPNIVELVGYCDEKGHRLLVYKLCKYGTLFDALHTNEDMKEKLTWKSRVNIVLQAAKALEYLHEECDPSVMHRNFKSSNVLIDHDFSVRISDCGLSSLMTPSSEIQLMGCGYVAPEYEVGSSIHQTDVYLFGIVMLELLTGRRPHDRSLPSGEKILVRWAIPRLHDIDALSKMVDPKLGNIYHSKSLSRFADLISLCLQAEPEFRPRVSEIVEGLEELMRRENEWSNQF